jgi:hypothetical protein
MKNAPGHPGAPGRAGVSVRMACALCVWLLAVSVSMAMLIGYANSPGDPGSPPTEWPTASRLPLGRDHSTLLMFVHPRCPCSRASMGELELLMARSQRCLYARVVFVRPPGVAEDWVKTDLWKQAAAIPGVTVHVDEDGVEAHLFRSETSGETLLYGQDGGLEFQGGITESRGHSGDNVGRSAITDIVQNGFSKPVRTRVFGCSLFACNAPKGKSQ